MTDKECPRCGNPLSSSDGALVCPKGHEYQSKSAAPQEFYSIPVVSAGMEDIPHDELKGAIDNLRALGFAVLQIGLKDSRPAYLVQEFDSSIDVTPRDEAKIDFRRVVGDVD